MTNKQKEVKEATQTVLMSGKVNGKDMVVGVQDANIDWEKVPYVFRSIASNVYENVYNPQISIRDSFDRYDYDYYRPGEYIPKDDRGKIIACMRAYKKSGNGIIKNIVDLIADLVTQGIDVVHKKKKNEKFGKAWFNKLVEGKSVSERFVSLLCRAGNDIIKRDIGKIPLNKIRKLYKGVSKDGETYQPKEEIIPLKREIPVKYTFIDPRIISVVQPGLAMFVNNSDLKYALEIPSDVMRAISNPITDQDKVLVNMIPADITSLVRKGNRLLPLDTKKFRFAFYKKDDWEVWADPMIYTILSDLQALEKMKLSDLSALDGVLAQIRVWKLGNATAGIRCTQPEMNRLAQILMNGTSGGILDIIWNDSIECQDIASQLHQFLGTSKYEPILNAIYTGLGVPPLFAGAKSEGSFTSNFLAIKGFIVRLEYFRDKLREFWEKEFEMLQQAMEWDEPLMLVFDRMTLNDESSILKIMLDMVDRGILSDEAMKEMVGAIPEIETFRVKREWQDRKNKKIPPKASLFHKPDFENDWISKFIQTGEIAPSQVGLELDPVAKGDVVPNKEADKRGGTSKGPIGVAGRPQGAKDGVKRKQKVVKPQRGVSSEMAKNTIWAFEYQNKLNEYLTPLYLGMLSKKNLRQLTNEEFNSFEKLKLSVLVNTGLGSKFDEGEIKEKLSANLEIPTHISKLLASMINNYRKDGVEPTIDTIRNLQCIVYAADNLSDFVS